jgi:4-carboxymuconolactone decarboxylase
MMTPNNRPHHNPDALFQNHVSALAATDPELIEVLGNFAFDEVLRESTLDARIRLIVQLSAIVASQALGEYRGMLGRMSLRMCASATVARDSSMC